MKEERKNRKSEHTAGMDTEQMAVLQEETESMTEEELAQFRNSLDSDSMGFCGEEGT